VIRFYLRLKTLTFIFKYNFYIGNIKDFSHCGFRLYSVGGRDGSSCLSSMEYYDPHTNKWSMCAPMCKRRGGVGVATCDGFLYAVGGHDAPASNHCSRLLDYVER
jgi:hypothetical protein